MSRSVVLSLGFAAALAGGVLAIWLVIDRDDAETVIVDERAGVLRGVRFGDTAEEVRTLLGEPTDDDDGFFPAGADYTGPVSIPSPSSDQDDRIPPQELHYGDTAFLVSPSVGVFSMAELSGAARTRAGVGVGDDLARVRQAYERVDCGESVAGEPLFGGDPPMYSWCRAIVDDIRVFFGADPIESITLTRLAGAG